MESATRKCEVGRVGEDGRSWVGDKDVGGGQCGYGDNNIED